MMRLRIIVHLGLLLLVSSAFYGASQPKVPDADASPAREILRKGDPEQMTYTRLSGAELVTRLTDPDSRSRAFYELSRRGSPGKHEDFEEFEDRHYDPEVVVCPQENGRPPIYVVLCGFIPRATERNDSGYLVENPDQLFPRVPGIPRASRIEHPLIEAFDGKGNRITPFGSNNVLDGALLDVNGDGLIERVEVTNYGVEGIKNVSVLNVETVREKARPLLSLLLNWGADEWTFQLEDRDGDGLREIEAGPRIRGGMKVKATWKWDPAKDRYTGPDGGDGDHFRVLKRDEVWDQLERLKRQKLSFPKDPDVVSAAEADAAPTDVAEKPAAPGAQGAAAARPDGPYRHGSLKGLSDAELIRFMARGKSEFDREMEARPKTTVPAAFWDGDAKVAARALLEANRTEKHRADFQVAIDDRDRAQPPERCTVALSGASSRCYQASDAHFFLRVDPEDSYLAYVHTSSSGVVFYHAVHNQPTFDFRLCRVSYADARRSSDAIWWLDRARSRPVRDERSLGHSFMSSTADGDARVVLRDERRVLINRSATLWHGELPERWSENYDPETFVNFAAKLVTTALTERLGREWSQHEKKQAMGIREPGGPPRHPPEELARMAKLADQFLAWFSPKEERVSLAVVAEAARFAGARMQANAAERLRAIHAGLPAAEPKKRDSDAVFAELGELPLASQVKKRERGKLAEKRAALNAELEDLLHDLGQNSAAHTRKVIDLSLRQIEEGNDPERLLAWAKSKGEEHQWAFQRLAELDRKRYAEVLETLLRSSEPHWAVQFFAELQEVAPERAKALALDLPKEQSDPLAVSAFRFLKKADALPNEAERIAALIRVMHTPKLGFDERRQAIEALVPVEEPLRYPDRKIDEALLRLLEPEQADPLINFTLDYACLALARRGRTDLFDRIAEVFRRPQRSDSEPPEIHTYPGVLGALTQLAQADPGRLNPRLLAIIRPQLASTNQQMTEILWAVWSANLRELNADMQRLGTAGPDAFEDRKANSSGGKVSPVTGHFHLARQIAALWEEPDALTRARLLVAFATMHAYTFVMDPKPERLARLKGEMHSAAAALSPAERLQLAEFLERLKAQPLQNEDGLVTREVCQEITALARKAFEIQEGR